MSDKRGTMSAGCDSERLTAYGGSEPEGAGDSHIVHRLSGDSHIVRGDLT